MMIRSVLFGIVLGSTLLAQAQPPRTTVTAIRSARLFDGTSDTTVADAVVIVEGTPHQRRRIAPGDAARRHGHRPRRRDAAARLHRRAHAPVGRERRTTGTPTRSQACGAPLPKRRCAPRTFARRTLMAGFTTVRDVGAGDYIDVGLRNAIAAGSSSARACSSRCTRSARAAATATTTGFPYQRFGAETRASQDGIASGPDQFRDAVRFQVKYGADVIKVCATGGVLSLADEVGYAAAHAGRDGRARRRGAPARPRAAAHAHGAEGAKVAIRAGIDSIEHGSFLDDESGADDEGARARTWCRR